MQLRFFENKAPETDAIEMQTRMSENQSDAEFAARGTLHIPEEAAVHFCPDPEGKSLLRPITHTKISQDLFLHPPCFQDINQGGLTGDCYLLASLLAILALPQGAASIQSMMKDEGGTVVVRLFDDYHKPRFMRLEKSVPHHFGILNSGALWVKLMEKAYAAFHGGRYSILEKGFSHTAMAALAGASNQYFLEGYCSFPFQSAKSLASLRDYVDGNGVYLLNELMRLTPSTPRAIQKRMSQQVFQDNLNLFQQWMQWIQGKQDIWMKLIQRCHPVCKQDVREFFSSCAISVEAEEAVGKVKAWLEKEKVLSGPALTGEYSREELDLFTAIQKRLRQNCPMTVSTDEDFKEGLLPRHTYAVTGCEENAETHRKYIFVQNPHGASRSFLSKMFISGGRTSEDVLQSGAVRQWVVKIKSTDQSVSRMELSDFCQAFAFIDAFSAVTVQAMNERVKADCRLVSGNKC
ncbi:hypothetical protein AQUSIP_06050 [Aquicella siphonis]|uniref:Calpain catalytic domain-containing protein n=1 Tax=Aquicella siphonis TaxID=254247 RepID=A0A5E4PG46_9COXI|nr:C2 family cysteine protease [Aquicella siphonis]VVC75316.1 hypothetical protein AQUSIP_06050 [Aquicella siphonis]